MHRTGARRVKSRLVLTSYPHVWLLASQALAISVVSVAQPATSVAASLDDLPAGHWYEVPNSRLETVFPNPTPPGISGPASVMDAWSGGAYDSVRDRLIVWGGGHCDYAGNELYTFDVATESWARVTEPSSPVVEGVSHYPDGNPSSRHTYDTLTFLPQTGEFVSVSAAGYFCGQSGSYTRATDIFNFALNRWERGANFPSVGGSTGAVSAYDPVTGHVWFHGTYGSGRLAEYDPDADSWTAHGSSIYLEIDGVAAIDSNRHQMLLVGGYGNQNRAFLWDLDNPGRGYTEPPTFGADALESEQGIGLEYDPVSDLYVAWNGGSDVFTLNPETWEWRRVSPANTNTVQGPTRTRNGTYGRFRYMPSKNAFIVVSHTDDNVYYYRLSEGAGQPAPAPVPSIEFSASPDTVSSGGSATLAWTTGDATSCTASGDWSGDKSVSANGEEYTESVGPITQTSAYTLECAGPGGSATESVTVTVQSAQPSPTVELTASATTLAAGSSVNLDWSSTDTDMCTASGGWTGSKPTAGNESVGPIDASTNFLLSCSGPGGSDQASVFVNVESASDDSPALEFNSDVTEVDAGGSATLSWESSNSTTCQASGAWAGAKPVNGSETIGPINTDSTFSQTCTSGGVAVSKSVTVRVRAATPSTPPPAPDRSNSESGGGSLSWLLALMLLARAIVGRPLAHRVEA